MYIILYTNQLTELFIAQYCKVMKPARARQTPIARISPRAHALLRKLASEEHSSMQAVLDKAIEHYRRETFIRAANSEFAALKRDKKAWKQEIEERKLWEQTLHDGMSED